MRLNEADEQFSIVISKFLSDFFHQFEILFQSHINTQSGIFHISMKLHNTNIKVGSALFNVVP